MLATSYFFYVLEGVHFGAGPLINYQRIAQLFLLLAVLGGHHEAGVGGGESEAVDGVLAHLEVLDLGELGHLAGGQVYDGEAVFGHVIGLFLLDLGAPGFLELRLDEADGELFVFRQFGAVSAGDLYDAPLLAHHFDGEDAVPFLRVHFVAHHIAGRANIHVSNGLPAVVYRVVQGFLLGG